MKKLFFLVSILALTSVALNAQVTIGINQVPNSDAVLELTTYDNNKGFLPPRIALVAPHNPAPLSAHVEGMVVYNTTVLKDSLIAGLYMNNGTKWIALRQAPYLQPNWFYMPSFPINISVSGNFTIDLWEEYQTQFDNLAAGTTIKSDASAPRIQPKMNAATDLYYYVVGFDETVFSNVQLTNDGKLKYTVNSGNASDSTFMNIVLVVK